MGNTITHFFSYVLNLLNKPLRQDFYFYLSILFYSSIVQVIAYILIESVSKALFIGLHHIIICYLLVLPLNFIPFKKTYKLIIYLLLTINYVLDFVCIYIYKFVFDRDITAILLGTNNSEAIEFLQTFLSIDLILWLLSGLTVTFLLSVLLHRTKISLGKIGAIIGLTFILLSLVAIHSKGGKNWPNISVAKIYTFLNTTTPPDLRAYFTNPTLEKTGEKKPRYIVLIIGESLTKTHMSLYGYTKSTNPCLEKLEKSSSLYIFDNIEAPATNTIASFKALMSTYSYLNQSSQEWYEGTTILEIMKLAGYKTSWISNQSAKGWHDNIVAKFAELADSTIYVGNKFAGLQKDDKDGLILEILPELVTNEDDKYYFHIIHLMGNHHAFEKRYPEEFNKFSPNDYSLFPVHQRHDLATYDNSVLYNDFVVSSIMENYKNEEAVVIYFPDHSIDLYETSNDYVGHGRGYDTESSRIGHRIPFMFYLSTKYKDEFPEVASKISQIQSREYNTEHIIYTLMQLAGVRFKSNEDVANFSLLVP